MFKVARVSSVIAVSTALICAVALPATAAEIPPVESTLTVTILDTGTLQISAPRQPEAFGNVTPGIGVTRTTNMDVTVTDTRGSTLGTGQWFASVKLANFAGSKLDNADIIPAGAVMYLPGDLTDTNQVVGTILDPLKGLTQGSLILHGPTAAFALKNDDTRVRWALNITGNNTVTWHPGLVLSVPENIAADTYTATLTHSVA